MNIEQAIWLVVEDQRQSYPEMTSDEAVAHARNTVSLEPAVGACVLYDDGTETYEAYRIVLGA